MSTDSLSDNNVSKDCLVRGKYPCICMGKRKCKKEAYWKWKFIDFCDRHLPFHARIMFLYNEWEYSNTESDSESDDKSDCKPDSNNHDLEGDVVSYSEYISQFGLELESDFKTVN
jgi:hypothetical protein